jgi:hypothetical protein
MKKTLILSLLCTCTILTVCSQGIAVPAAVTRAFEARFPNATDVKWEKENKKELEANFKVDNVITSANFGLDGTWKETETRIQSGNLPPTVTKAIADKYPGSNIDRCERIEKPGNAISYEVNIRLKNKKKELELDETGRFIN